MTDRRGPAILGLAVFCLNLCAWPLATAFLKSPEWRAPYLLSVSVLTTLFLLVVEPRTESSLARFVVYAGLGGETSAVIALQIAKLFDRIDRLAAFQRPTFIEFLASIVTIDALVAALLGGWLTAMMAALIMRVSSRYPGRDRV